MPFQFTCPYCFKKTLVEDSLAGRAGPCACCGRTVTLPDLPSRAREAPVHMAGADHATQSASYAVAPPVIQDRPSGEAVDGPATKNVARRVVIVGALSLAALLLVGYVSWKTINVVLSSNWVVAIQGTRDRAMCLNNLTKIARALNAYAAQHGTYPPPIVYDDKGKPKHSWRVLILRELGENTLYNKYDFDQSWDSEVNQKLFTECPDVFISPAHLRNGNATESNYFLVVGGNTLFPPGGPLSPEDIADGAHSTLLVVEGANLIHEWTKPIDVAVGGSGQIKMGGNHQGGTNAAMADGAPAWIPSDTAPETVQSLVTPAGGEFVDPGVYKL